MQLVKSNWFLERHGKRHYTVRLLVGENVIGRLSKSTIIINQENPSRYISRLHCKIIVNEENVTITDFSSNGTFVNEKKIEMANYQLNENDKIGVGVYNVSDVLLQNNEEYHVYSLRKIKHTIELVKEVEHEETAESLSPKSNINLEIIDLIDSDDDIEMVAIEQPIKIKLEPICSKIPENAGVQSMNITEISDDEEFCASQAVLEDIKQEFVELDNELLCNNDDNSNVRTANLPIVTDKVFSPIYNLDSGDEEFDDTTKNWFLKLSQGVEKKKEKNTQEIINDINKNIVKKIPTIIDSPHLPVHKGKLRGVCADRKHKTQTPTKRKNNKKSLESATVFKELRNERLKSLAVKDTEKKTTSKDKLPTKTIVIPKAKITHTNRGAFLTEQLEIKQPKRRNSTKNCDSNSSEIQPKKTYENISTLKRPSSSINNMDNLKQIKLSDSAGTESVWQPRKLSFKSLPSIETQQIPSSKNITKKSILLKSHKDQNTVIKKVRFKDKPTIIYFESETVRPFPSEQMNMNSKIIDCKDASFDFSNINDRIRKLHNANLTDYTDSILTDILRWKTVWLENGTQEVNGPNHVLMPMKHYFENLNDYISTIFPLMKLELWVRLHKDLLNNMYEAMTVDICSFQTEEKSEHKRIVIHFKYYISAVNAAKHLFIGDLLIVKIDYLQLFAYIRGCHKISDFNAPCFMFIIEMEHDKKILRLLRQINKMKIKKVSSIVVELGEFNCIKRLQHSPLINEILNPEKLIKNYSSPIEDIKFIGYSTYLNDGQKNIILKTYLKCIDPKKPNISLIEGPPGTGKSTLILNLVLQILYGRQVRHLDRRILICAPSNVTVDELALKLINVRRKMSSHTQKFRLVRYGVPDRIHHLVYPYSLTGLINHNKKCVGYNNERIFIENRIKTILQNNRSNSVEQDELIKLKEDLRRIEAAFPNNNMHDQDLHSQYLRNANIVCTTLSSCVKLMKYMKYFDICIIDEASQCKEPWSLIPLQFNINSLVLVGDKQQLPATVYSKWSKTYNYGKSLFVRIQEYVQQKDNNINSMMSLTTQYRMHPEICRWPNSYFYNDTLISEFKDKNPINIKPYTIFSLDYQNNANSSNGKISNSDEGLFVIRLVKSLSKFLPLKLFSYGIISPYSSHRDYIQLKLREENILEVEVHTIDAFQGKERDVIIISNARTDGIGFLRDPSRLNVALTRAKRCLILCGNFSQLEHVPVWKSLLDDAKNRKIYYNITKKDAENFETNVLSKIKM